MALRKALSNGSGNHIGYSPRSHANEQAETLLEGIKHKAGATIRVAITKRTSIELPASLTQDEIDARVMKYKKLHASKV